MSKQLQQSSLSAAYENRTCSATRVRKSYRCLGRPQEGLRTRVTEGAPEAALTPISHQALGCECSANGLRRSGTAARPYEGLYQGMKPAGLPAQLATSPHFSPLSQRLGRKAQRPWLAATVRAHRPAYSMSASGRDESEPGMQEKQPQATRPLPTVTAAQRLLLGGAGR